MRKYWRFGFGFGVRLEEEHFSFEVNWGSRGKAILGHSDGKVFSTPSSTPIREGDFTVRGDNPSQTLKRQSHIQAPDKATDLYID